jgi:HSP20 family protein
VLAVTIPKQEVASYRPDVRVVEIEGSDWKSSVD